VSIHRRIFFGAAASWFSRILRKIQHWSVGRRDALIAKVLEEYAANSNDTVLVQIGSNDGKTNDPFYGHIIARGWSALLVEPVPFIYERLVENHRGNAGVITANVAISDQDENRNFYHLRRTDSPNAPWWYDQIGSFDREQVLKSRNEIPDIDELLTSTEVRCVSLRSLLENHGIRSIDILHTDLEGYDSRVIRQLDFSRWSPHVILFENKHLPSSERTAVVGILEEAGYRLIHGSADTLAVKKVLR
jgi:FkbM family methyltransferase